MTHVQKFIRFAHRIAPDVDVQVEHYAGGRTFLNLRQPETHRLIVVEHRPRQGFSVSAVQATSSWTGFGSRPNSEFVNLISAERQVEKLLTKNLPAKARHAMIS